MSDDRDRTVLENVEAAIEDIRRAAEQKDLTQLRGALMYWFQFLYNLGRSSLQAANLKESVGELTRKVRRPPSETFRSPQPGQPDRDPEDPGSGGGRTD